MSGVSTSITLITTLADAMAGADIVRTTGKVPDVVQSANSSVPFLCVQSRNNALEANFRNFLMSYPHAGLSYFLTWDEVTTLDHRPICVALGDGALADAIEGIRFVLTAMRQDTSRCISTWMGAGHGEGAEQICDVLSEPWPSSFTEALRRVERGDDNDGFEGVVAFLQAHLLCLEAARDLQLSVLYAVWLY